MSSSNMMSSNNQGNEKVDEAIDQVKLTPDDWAARKLAASMLYDSKNYSEAAELLWDAPELPFLSHDIAFSVRVLAKWNPENAIRVVNESMRRVGESADGFLRLGEAFHEQGLPLLASRMYGAALAISNENFDIGFEQESLWLDDHDALVLEWKNQACDPQPNQPAPMKNFLGKAISFLEYTQRITEYVKEGVKEEVNGVASTSAILRVPAAVTSPKLLVSPQATNPTVPLFIPKAKPVDEAK